MKSAVLSFVLVSVVAVRSVAAEPPRPELTVSAGPAYAHLRGDGSIPNGTHGRDYAAPALEVSVSVGARVSSMLGLHAVAFGDLGSSACTELIDLARSPDAPPLPPTCVGEGSLHGGGLGIGISFAEPRDGLFIASSLWAGTLIIEPLRDVNFGVVTREPDLWYGGALTIGWTRRVRPHFDIGAALTARIGYGADVIRSFNRARTGSLALLVGWR